MLGALIVRGVEAGESGTFIPQSLPEDAFRPLWDWIDYVLDYEKQPLQAWVQASQFDFEAFVCEEDVRRALAAGRKVFINERTIVTPSARDLADEHDVFVAMNGRGR